MVWKGLTGVVDPSVGRQAMWLYLAVALLVLPVLVPFAIRAVEPDPGRRRTIAHLGTVGAGLAAVYLVGMLQGPVDVRIEGNHLAYRLHMDHGGLAGIYAIVACAPPMLSSERNIALFGSANLAAVVVLVWIESSALSPCGTPGPQSRVSPSLLISAG